MNINTRDMPFILFNETDMPFVTFNGVTVYEAFKNLIASGFPPLTLNKCKGVDLVDYKIYGESTQGNINTRDLPSEYTEVEYIESTGTQYIDTGIIPNQNIGFDIVYLSKNVIGASNFGCIMGTREKSSVKDFQLTSYSTSVTNVLGTLRFGTTSNNAGITVNKKMHSTLMNKVYTNNEGVEITLTDTFTCPKSLTVFALNNNGTVTQHGKVQLYSLKLYNGEALVRDFVPCYRKSDNELGLYDLVESKFYVNKGSGDFLKKEPTPTPTAPIEVESVGDKTSNLINLVRETTEIAGNPTTTVELDTTKVYLSYAGSGYFTIGRVSNLEITKSKISFSSTHAWYGVAFPIKAEPNKKYTFSWETDCENARANIGYYSQGMFLKYTSILSTTKTVKEITPENCDTVVISIVPSVKNEIVWAENIQWQEGNVASVYAPYGYKIPVKSSGKNLWGCDIKEYTVDTKGKSYVLDNPITKSCTFYYRATDYTCDGNIWIIGFRRKDGNYTYLYPNHVKRNDIIKINVTEDNPITMIEIRNGGANYISGGKIDNFMLVEGTYTVDTMPEYELYQEPITTNIFLDEPLRKIGNYADYVDFANQKVVRNVILDNVSLANYTSIRQDLGWADGYVRGLVDSTNIKNRVAGNENALSNKLIGIANAQVKNNGFRNLSAHFEVQFDLDLIGGTTTSTRNELYELVSSFLELNPIEIYLALKTPTEETIELSNIPTLKGTTLLSVDTEILPSNMEVIYKGKN